MKPDEIKALDELPETIVGLRAPRDGESDCLSYTLSPERVAMFARQREAKEIVLYDINKKDVMAFFTRRGESELLVLNRSNACKVGSAAINPPV